MRSKEVKRTSKGNQVNKQGDHGMAAARRNSRCSDHPYNLRRAIERFERGYLQNILVLTGWDQMRASEMLGIRPKTLEIKLKKYELR